MNPLPLGKDHVRRYLRGIIPLLQRSLPFVGLLFFAYMLVQPHRFEVAATDTTEVVDDALQEVYDELLANAQKETTDGDIQFENLISFEDGDNKITYTTSPGDTLGEIAKLFGTTIQAIRDANDMGSSSLLRVGERLTIAYDKSIIYEMKESMSVKEFAEKYDMSEEDLLTLNYVDTEEDMLEEGQQIFIPLNKVEAEQRGLMEKRKFVMLDLPSEKEPEEKEISSGDVEVSIPTVPGEEQVVITAEETASRLEQLKLAKIEAKQAEAKAKELAKQAEEAAERARIEQAQEKAEAARLAQIEAEKKAEAARLAKIESEKKAEILKQAEAKESARQAEAVKDLCGANQCYHEGKCRSKPTHANCAPQEDGDNAWLCKDGYVDTGRSCISKADHTKKTAQATAPKKSQGTLNQRYFNPYNEGYSNGRGGGHCTHYAGYYWKKNYGIMTNWRGNAKLWYDNANAAGRQVGQTPEIGSIIVMKYGSSGWNGYGHVGAVINIDRKSRQVLIEDMNYVGRYVVSQHWVDMDSTRNPVIGYVYPRKK